MPSLGVLTPEQAEKLGVPRVRLVIAPARAGQSRKQKPGKPEAEKADKQLKPQERQADKP